MAVRSTQLVAVRLTANAGPLVQYVVPANYTVLIKDVSWSTDSGSASTFVVDLLPAGLARALLLLRVAPVGAAPLSGEISRWNVARAGDAIRTTITGGAAFSVVLVVSGAALLDF